MSDTYIAGQLKRIADALEKMAAAAQPLSPDHRFPISEYRNFDWGSLGARVIKADPTGPGVVEWNGYTFVRRLAESAKMGKAIIFSRNAGMGEDGAEYHTLVKFSDSLKIEELPDHIVRVAGKPTPPPPPQAPTTVTPPPTTPPLSSTPPVPTTTPPPQSGQGGQEHWLKEAVAAANGFLLVTAMQKLLPDVNLGSLHKSIELFYPNGIDDDVILEPVLAQELTTKVMTYWDARRRGEKSPVSIALESWAKVWKEKNRETN